MLKISRSIHPSMPLRVQPMARMHGLNLFQYRNLNKNFQFRSFSKSFNSFRLNSQISSFSSNSFNSFRLNSKISSFSSKSFHFKPFNSSFKPFNSSFKPFHSSFKPFHSSFNHFHSSFKPFQINLKNFLFPNQIRLFSNKTSVLPHKSPLMTLEYQNWPNSAPREVYPTPQNISFGHKVNVASEMPLCEREKVVEELYNMLSLRFNHMYPEDKHSSKFASLQYQEELREALDLLANTKDIGRNKLEEFKFKFASESQLLEQVEQRFLEDDIWSLQADLLYESFLENPSNLQKLRNDLYKEHSESDAIIIWSRFEKKMQEDQPKEAEIQENNSEENHSQKNISEEKVLQTNSISHFDKIGLFHGGRGVGKTKIMNGLVDLLRSSSGKGPFARMLSNSQECLQINISFSPNSSTPICANENKLSVEQMIAIRVLFSVDQQGLPFQTFVERQLPPKSLQNVIEQLRNQSSQKQSLVFLCVDDIDCLLEPPPPRKRFSLFSSNLPKIELNQVVDILYNWQQYLSHNEICFQVAAFSSASNPRIPLFSDSRILSCKLLPLLNPKSLYGMLSFLAELPDFAPWMSSWHHNPTFLRLMHDAAGHPRFLQILLEESMIEAQIHRYEGRFHMLNDPKLAGSENDQPWWPIISQSEPPKPISEHNIHRILSTTMTRFKEAVGLTASAHILTPTIRKRLVHAVVFGEIVDPNEVIDKGLTFQDLEIAGWILLDHLSRPCIPFSIMMELVSQFDPLTSSGSQGHSVLGMEGIESSLSWQPSKDYFVEVEALRRNLLAGSVVPLFSEKEGGLFPHVLVSPSFEPINIQIQPAELIVAQESFPQTLTLTCSREPKGLIVKPFSWWDGNSVVLNGPEPKNPGTVLDNDLSNVSLTRINEQPEEDLSEIPTQILKVVQPELKIGEEYRGFFPVDAFSLYSVADKPEERVVVFTQVDWPSQSLTSELLLERVINLNEIWVETCEKIKSHVKSLSSQLSHIQNVYSSYKKSMPWSEKTFLRKQLKVLPIELEKWKQCASSVESVKSIVLLAVCTQPFSGNLQDLPPNCLLLPQSQLDQYFGPSLGAHFRGIQTVRPIQPNESDIEEFSQIPGSNRFWLKEIEEERSKNGYFTDLDNFLERMDMKPIHKRFYESFLRFPKQRPRWMSQDWRKALRILKAPIELTRVINYTWDNVDPYDNAFKDLKTGGKDAPLDIIQWHSSESARFTWEKHDPTEYLFSIGNVDWPNKSRWQIMRETQEKLMGVPQTANMKPLFYPDENPLEQARAVEDKLGLPPDIPFVSSTPNKPLKPTPSQIQFQEELKRYPSDFSPTESLFDHALMNLDQSHFDHLFPKPEANPYGDQMPPEEEENQN